MKKLVVAVALGALAAPAPAVAQPAAADRQEAKRECLALKNAAETRANFAQVVRLEAKKVTPRNAFGKCVSERASKAQQERSEARRSAFAMCEQFKPGSDTRGQNRERGRAYGQCVSENARAKNRQADREQRERSTNPARACRTEQESGAEAFKARYGTNESKSNAFGKCVSSKASDDAGTETPQQQ